MVIMALGIILIWCAGEELVNKSLGYGILVVGAVIFLFGAVGVCSYKCCECTSYSIAIIILLIAELLGALCVMSVMDKVDIDTWPMGGVKDTFNKGVNTTFYNCCVNEASKSSCDFFPTLCDAKTADELKDNIVKEMNKYTNTILGIIIAVMVIEIIILAATCCVKAAKDSDISCL